MKIARIIYDWPPPWQGLAPAPYEMSKAQVRLGHTLDVFCGMWPGSGEIEQISGVTLHPFYREPFPGSLNLTISVWLFFSYLNWRRKNKIDILHSHGHFGIWIYLYRLILKKIMPWSNEATTPLIAHFHNTVEGREESLQKRDTPVKWYSKYIAWPLGKLSDKWAVAAADACIFVSGDTRDQAIKFYKANPDKCFVVESGVNPELFKPIGREEFEKTRSDLNLDPLDKVILNTGIMLERKNIHLLLGALLHLPHNYKVMLVGPGDPKYLQQLSDFIAQKNLKDRVIRVGYTPYPQQPIAYQAADVFVLPSSFEGLPKVVMESLACGVPTLVSGFRIQEEIEGVYYLQNLDTAEIAAEIKHIIENPKRVNVNKVVTLYSWDEKARQVDKVYEFAQNKYKK